MPARIATLPRPKGSDRYRRVTILRSPGPGTNIALPDFDRARKYSSMKQLSLTLLLVLFLGSAAAYGQSVARLELPSAAATSTKSITEVSDERMLTARAIAALKRLEGDVLIY